MSVPGFHAARFTLVHQNVSTAMHTCLHASMHRLTSQEQFSIAWSEVQVAKWRSAANYVKGPVKLAYFCTKLLK